MIGVLSCDLVGCVVVYCMVWLVGGVVMWRLYEVGQKKDKAFLIYLLPRHLLAVDLKSKMMSFVN